MAEYIEKQATIDAIFTRFAREYWQDIIMSLPPADVKQVVLCEKCRWFTDTGFENLDSDRPELRMGHCLNLGRVVQACWFCADGDTE